MSWTDSFPVFGDDQAEEFLSLATDEEVASLTDWFEVSHVINRRDPSLDLIATSLFWKGRFQSEPEIVGISRATMESASAQGIVSVFEPWEHYVVPLLEGAEILRAARPDVCLRIYLAADLDFLIDDLVAAGCEVAVMKSSSIRHNPGAMWRFLALAEEGRRVTIIDADRGKSILHDLERSELTFASGYGAWRTPYYFAKNNKIGEPGHYRPINACHFGMIGGHSVELLMKAFVWHTLRGTMPGVCTITEDRTDEMSGSKWPDYGFDEWFLLAAMYPRIAGDGVLTLIAWNDHLLNHWFALDIEYVTWANPKSEICYFDPMPALPDRQLEGKIPWEDWEDPQRLKVRENTTVYKRRRKRLGPAHGIFGAQPPPEIASFEEIAGDLRTALGWAGSNVVTEWWVDLNPALYLSQNGGELFLDRRYQDADVVFCGFFFARVDAAISVWAKSHGIDSPAWSEGKLLKLPKLEGPMTLWKTSFSRTFHQEVERMPREIRPEILMKIWIDQSKVIHYRTMANKMGWQVR